MVVVLWRKQMSPGWFRVLVGWETICIKECSLVCLPCHIDIASWMRWYLAEKRCFLFR